jgi:hypothetical protein
LLLAEQSLFSVEKFDACFFLGERHDKVGESNHMPSPLGK